jgi:3-hydroxybutyryl-CoA dehydrogenase
VSVVHRVGVVGAGTMGSGIAQVCAQNGCDVLWFDAVPAAIDRGRAVIKRSLDRFVLKGVIGDPARVQALERIQVVPRLEAMADVECVIEAITEQLDAKRAVFAELDRVIPPTALLASNTSSLSLTVLGAATSSPQRVLGLHFMNPAPLMALVELVAGQHTSADSMDRGEALCRQLGKTPVRAADYPGFLVNRILMPMINEAVFALMEGVGPADAIDTAMTLGTNQPIGPLALADLIGLDTCVAIMEVLHDGLGDPKYAPCPLLRQYVAAGRLGRKSGRGFYDYA